MNDFFPEVVSSVSTTRKPRDYQREDVDAIFSELEKVRSTLYVAATGLGKTFVMGELVLRTLPKRVLLLAHRKELLFQARNSFLEHGIESDIEQAELVASTHEFSRSPVVIASVQTLLSGEIDRKRMKRFNPHDFGLLLYDESHHSVSVGNKSIVDYFLNGNPDLKCVGVTATPDRADEVALGQIFNSVAASRDILFGINEGWLVNIEQVFVPVAGLDFSHVKTTAGDLNGAELAKVMEAESNIQGIVHPTLESLFGLPLHSLDSISADVWGRHLLENKTRKRKAIVFTASVIQAEMLSNIFNRVIPDLSQWVCGKTTDRERADIFKDFKSGKTSILVNVGVTTEGFNDPNVDLIVMARPTKSRSLYCQCIGRGTRPIEGLIDGIDLKEDRLAAISNSPKPDVLVMDFVGNSGRHKLISLADVLGGKSSEEAKGRALDRAKKEKQPVRIMELLADEEEKIRAEKEAARLREEARKCRLVAKVDYSTTNISPFDKYAVRQQKPSSWDSENGRFFSDKQKKILNKIGVDPDSISISCGRKLIGAYFEKSSGEPPTPAQAYTLRKIGKDPTQFTKSTASKVIGEHYASKENPVNREEGKAAFQKMREAIV
ncbi:MAG: DEAD/DEAH box helicase [Patescibacteria group bacterium]|nr:DEAD/DEAH box helicase [Patescibacteria group bacterium]